MRPNERISYCRHLWFGFDVERETQTIRVVLAYYLAGE